MSNGAGDQNAAALHLAIQRLAQVHAVVQFEPNGVLRLAAQHPHDSDDRVLVRIPGAEADWQGTLCAGAEVLVNDLAAVAARRSLRVVR